jgi:beta-lactamase regulating signal transducer with metallopeptidase domain
MSELILIILDSALKGAVILTMAGAIALGLRRASAAVRHMVWTLAVVSICVVPVLSARAPGWRVPVLPHSVLGPAAVPSRPQAWSHPFRAEVDPERVLQGGDGVLAAVAPGDAKRPNPKPASAQRWLRWFLLCWASGMSIVLSRLLISLVAAWLGELRSAPITDGVFKSLADEIARRYGIRRRVALRISANRTIPATWGLIQPVVLLPVEAMDWPQDRLRSVLAHELAHIARGDFLVQVVAWAACAWHWFNPLVWLAARRLRIECEQASDDLVLETGLTPADYATHLVEVLKAVHRGAGADAPAVVLAMARLKGFEDRVRAILDSGRSRRDLSTRRVALMALGATCFLLPLGLVRLEARAHDAPKLERLPQGMTIEVVGVSPVPSGPATWWGPDGTPLAEAPCDPVDEAAPAPGSGQQVREVVVRIAGIPQRAALAWHPTQCRSHGTAQPRKNGAPVPGLQRAIAEFSREEATCNVHFDLSVGTWTTEQTSDGQGIGIEREDRAFFFGKARETVQGTALAIAHNISDREIRVVAIDQKGEEHVPTSSSWGGGKHLKMIDVEFSLPPRQIREYRFQSRPVGRFEIKNVALQPRKAG